MTEGVKLRQVRHSIDSCYYYLDSKTDFRLKVIVYSPTNKEVYSQEYKHYIVDSNKNIHFQNINIFIPIYYKILVNINHIDGNENKRAIYFDEISNNNGNIFL